MSNISMEMQNQPTRDILFREAGPSIEAQIAWYYQMRENQPIRYRPEYNLWEVFRYKDVQQVLLDSATFTKDKSLPESIPEGFPKALLKFAPSPHRQRRSLISKAFTPRRIEELRPHLVKIVDELLEPAKTSGKMEVVTGLASPLPVRVVAEMLGLPLSDQERFQQWSYQLLGQVMGIWNSDDNELFRYLSDLLDERKRDPRNDLMSALLAAEENGVYLTREEIINMCLELMFAGNVTTSILLSLALHRVCRYPEIYQALRNDPSLIPGTLEETLRYDFSPMAVWRMARHDTMLGGQEIKAGETVVVWTASANFDERQFPHPEQFDIRRSPNPHLTFGYGVHVCLGYPLARLEGHILLERIVAYFSEIHLNPEKPVQYAHQISSRLIQSLDILFTPAVSLAP
jgi:cytochrome P450